MKAKIKPRINLESRTRLEEAIPLSTPIILFVDPSNICNFRCKFCPTGHKEIIKDTGRWQNIMNFYVYRKIIDDLKEFNKPLKVLRLYKEGEPLLNKNFDRMVRYARKSGSVQYIDTTTNGYLLTEDLSKKILDAGLDRINISVNGMSDKQFLAFSGVNINFDEYVKNIKRLYEIRDNNGYNCEICIKTVGDFLTDIDKKKFYNTFGDYADRIFIENIAPCWPEFDVESNAEMNISKTKGIYDQPISDETEVDVCPYIFYMVSINSDGSVSLCFLDWARKLIIGDVKGQSLKEIWNGDILFKYQIYNLKGKRRDNPVCGKCGQLKYCLPDNIDPYVDIVTKRLLDSRNESI